MPRKAPLDKHKRELKHFVHSQQLIKSRDQTPSLAFKMEEGDSEPKSAGSLQKVQTADKKTGNSVLQPRGAELSPPPE